MTIHGLMSGKARFFDKQDQKRLDADWQTGFHNRDRLLFLKIKIGEVVWEPVKYRAGEEAVPVPVYWRIHTPS